MIPHATVYAYYKKNLLFDGEQNKYAGYYGDLTISGDISMNNEDYHADLDAVNTAQRMKDSGKSYMEISNDYYSEIDYGKTNRAEEFRDNEGMTIVEDTIYDSLVPSTSTTFEPGKGRSSRTWTDSERAQYLRDNYAESYNFNESVKNGDNNLTDYAGDEDYQSDKEK